MHLRRLKMFMSNDKIKSCIISETEIDDGYIGIPVKSTFLFDKDNFSFRRGFGGTPIMVYVVNASVFRIGTLSDEEIITGMLKRKMAVCVLDYMNNTLAGGKALYYSVQAVRKKVIDGSLFELPSEFGNGECPETLVVPSGYDVIFGHVYWEFDKHGAEGTIEKIVEIWNNDFRGTKPERLIKWSDGEGKRKAVTDAKDGTSPVWYDGDGNQNPDGEYTKVKYTVANCIGDCVKPDGSPLDLTQVEFQIMEIFMKNPETALERGKILDAVWGENYVGDVKIVDVNIRRLRMKVEEEPSNPRHITTMWGLGYKWMP